MGLAKEKKLNLNTVDIDLLDLCFHPQNYEIYYVQGICLT